MRWQRPRLVDMSLWTFSRLAREEEREAALAIGHFGRCAMSTRNRRHGSITINQAAGRRSGGGEVRGRRVYAGSVFYGVRHQAHVDENLRGTSPLSFILIE